MVTLEVLTQENWENCADLQVLQEQSEFIAPNIYSIAEAQFLPGFVVKGICYRHKMVGMLMYGIDPDDGNYWIYRLMVDQHHQKKGYAKQAMALLIDEIKEKNIQKVPFLMVGYHTKNTNAHYFYQRVGFVFQGMADWGENLAQYRLV
ncbi:GNAT family N-acetyltransferase [Providencia vermicola]|uniref:GNAT family N-acetyltransferase n=1 Tax=Providencia vermicola TaxID=333965 RepID=UPI002201059A|nr:GNAT family N-acetyltransferase [Providencia stuartii]